MPDSTFGVKRQTAWGAVRQTRSFLRSARWVKFIKSGGNLIPGRTAPHRIAPKGREREDFQGASGAQRLSRVVKQKVVGRRVTFRRLARTSRCPMHPSVCYVRICFRFENNYFVFGQRKAYILRCFSFSGFSRRREEDGLWMT